MSIQPTTQERQRANYGVAVFEWAVPETGERRRTPHLVFQVRWDRDEPDVYRWTSYCEAICGHPVGETVALDLRMLPGPEGACLDCHVRLRSQFLDEDAYLAAGGRVS